MTLRIMARILLVLTMEEVLQAGQQQQAVFELLLEMLPSAAAAALPLRGRPTFSKSLAREACRTWKFFCKARAQQGAAWRENIDRTFLGSINVLYAVVLYVICE